MGASFDITDEYLTETDIKLIIEAIALLQKKHSRNFIPTPLIFEAIKDQLTIPAPTIDLANFRKAISLSVKSNKIPGIISQLGKTGGFGPSLNKTPKKENNNVISVNVSSDVPSTSTLAVPKVVDKISQPVISTPPVVIQKVAKVETKVETKVEVTKPIIDEPLKIEKLKEVAAAVLQVEKAPIKILAPVKIVKQPSIPPPLQSGKIWNQERAKAFILAFADAASAFKDESSHLRRRADDASLNADATAALVRTTFGWDPTKINPSILRWDDLYDVVVPIVEKAG